MKKVININFHGRIIPIEESAYEILKKYIKSLNQYFALEEGKDEIINDIEGRIAELFEELLKKGITCIADIDVHKIIDSMGRPQDFEEQSFQTNPTSTKEERSNSYSYENTTRTEKFYRDENNKLLGGVCSGIANYFNVDSLIVRILFVFTAGVTFLPYLILWIATPSSASKVIGGQRKRLFRDPDNKMIAGVCSGLAQYFSIQIWIPRLLFLVPFISIIFRYSHIGFFDFPHFLSFSFSPGATLIYIIFWVLIPEARSTTEKLEMKGEKVDLYNIKTTIQGDLEGFKERAEKFGHEVKEKAQKWGQELEETLAEQHKNSNKQNYSSVKRVSRGIGDIISLIAKIFAYFILGIVLFIVVVALFALGIVATGLMPMKDFILTDGNENLLVWGTIILFVWVPVGALLTWIIRRVARIKGRSNFIRYTSLSLWLVGVFCFVSLCFSMKDNFSYNNHINEETIYLSNPHVHKLEFKATSSNHFIRNNWFNLEPFASFDEDTLFVQNVHIRIVKALTDSFSASMIKLANGSTKREADRIANNIFFNVEQKDSFLVLDKGIPITKKDKFRNQEVIITIAVPVGKKIKINDKVKFTNNVHVGFGNVDDWESNLSFNDTSYDWDDNIEYIMTEKGLKSINGQTVSTDEDNDDEIKQKNKEELQQQRYKKLKDLEDIERQLKDLPESTKIQTPNTNSTKPIAKKMDISAHVTPKIDPSMVELFMARFSI